MELTNTLLSKDRLLSVANVLSRGRRTAGWELRGGELVMAENLCREAMNTGLENCSPQNPRELAICKRLWLMYNQSAKASYSYPVSCTDLYGTLARHVPDLIPSR